MNPLQQNHLDLTRREFFGKSATGIGTIALSDLLNKDGLAANNERKAIGGLPELPHFKPKAKNIIYLFQNLHRNATYVTRLKLWQEINIHL